jgi:hypothetical protein
MTIGSNPREKTKTNDPSMIVVTLLIPQRFMRFENCHFLQN